ncbi:MAG: aspartate kinase, partial [Kofleriaceae bacterium]|nr:aspartate kinase [Kofleriaceae bacterium]
MVQKYGGSSVADVDKIRQVAARVARTKAAGKKVVVVVSAMGKTTNALIEKAKQVSPSPSRRELDMLLTCGEREAMALLAMAVSEQGLESISFTGSQAGIMTNDRHSGARILEVRPFRIEDELDRGKVVIVAGFQGVSYKREVTTLGRGGSDTTAVALAAALRADYCEICSDVDGVYTADPRVVGAAELLHAISHDEMLELAAQGAKVLHDASVEFARKSGIALYARATNKDGGGTRIDWSPERERQVAAVTGQAALVRLRASGGAAVENALQILEAAS